MNRVFILSDVNNPHTRKWVKGISQKGIEVSLYSLSADNSGTYDGLNNVKIYTAGFSVKNIRKLSGSFSKAQYLKVVPEVRKLLRIHQPQVLHAHFATSYGFIGALTGFHPFIVSAWGEDVYTFPLKSYFHKNILRLIFNSADKLLSTSRVMSEEIQKYASKEIAVTPFGVDTTKFSPQKVVSLFDQDELVIGCIKHLEPVYGLRTLIKAFAVAAETLNDKKLRLMIVGGGSEEQELKELAEKLNISGLVKFTGRVDPSEIEKYHNMCDFEVYPSIRESFGVTVLEAGACQKATIVSAVGGHVEIAPENVTSLHTEPVNHKMLAEKMEILIMDESFRAKLGENARKHVERFYNLEKSIEDMLSIYNEVAAG